MTGWARKGFLPTCLAILVSAALIVPLPFYLESPGRLLSLGSCVNVDVQDVDPILGDYLLTTVHLERATTAGLMLAAVRDDIGLVPVERLLPAGTDADGYFARQRQIFSQSSRLAAAIGLRSAGFQVDPDVFTGDGALVAGVLEGSPADGVLRVGDVILELEGRPVPTADALVDRMGAEPRPLRLTVERDGERVEVELTPEVTEVDGTTRPVLGVQVQTLNARVDLPVAFEIASGRIGGPSAGLMIAVTVYDLVNQDADLAAGRMIAGTGTMSSGGQVGRIGGVELKALAAARRGADVFLAPASQAEAARAKLPADSDLHVIAVESFDDAVAKLTRAQVALRSGDPVTPPERCPLAPAA